MAIHDYDPVVFLRCHSRNNDSADVQQQVWHCAFEPSASASNIVATCGGNSVCLIDCNTGTVTSKFYTKLGDKLFALSWGMVSIKKRPSNVIVCGGNPAVLYLLDVTSNACLYMHKITRLKSVSVNSILFDSKEKDVFFCATSDGEIRVCEMYENSKCEHSLKEYNTLSTGSEIFDLSFCQDTKTLLASCDEGLFMFNFNPDNSLKSKYKPFPRKVILPNNPNYTISQDNRTLVDSVEILGDGIFACKCALHGNIYICDLKSILNENRDERYKDVTGNPIKTLNWSQTDNYFMYMGVSSDKKLLGCGDDKGTLWLYNDVNSFKSDTKDVDFKLLWPQVIDHYNDKKRKLSLQTYDIVVAKIAISSDAEYIVSVTNNNLVCLWKKKS